jgi:hypothetical protein
MTPIAPGKLFTLHQLWCTLSKRGRLIGVASVLPNNRRGLGLDRSQNLNAHGERVEFRNEGAPQRPMIAPRKAVQLSVCLHEANE